MKIEVSYPVAPEQFATAHRHDERRGFTPLTVEEAERINRAREKRERKAAARGR